MLFFPLFAELLVPLWAEATAIVQDLRNNAASVESFAAALLVECPDKSFSYLSHCTAGELGIRMAEADPLRLEKLGIGAEACLHIVNLTASLFEGAKFLEGVWGKVW